MAQGAFDFGFAVDWMRKDLGIAMAEGKRWNAQMPVVALVDPTHQLAINADEVAAAFEVPLAFVLDPANHRRHAIEVSGARREWFSMPWREADGTERFIWGATAGMLKNLQFILNGG